MHVLFIEKIKEHLNNQCSEKPAKPCFLSNLKEIQVHSNFLIKKPNKLE